MMSSIRVQAADGQVRAVQEMEGRIAELQELHDAMIGQNIQYIESTLSGISFIRFVVLS